MEHLGDKKIFTYSLRRNEESITISVIATSLFLASRKMCIYQFIKGYWSYNHLSTTPFTREIIYDEVD